MAGTSIDDRAGCTVLLEVAKELKKIKNKPNVHIVFSTQEEFNLRGVIPMANILLPDIKILSAVEAPQRSNREQTSDDRRFFFLQQVIKYFPALKYFLLTIKFEAVST